MAKRPLTPAQTEALDHDNNGEAGGSLPKEPAPPVDNDHVEPGSTPFTEEEIAANAESSDEEENDESPPPWNEEYFRDRLLELARTYPEAAKLMVATGTAALIDRGEGGQAASAHGHDPRHWRG